MSRPTYEALTALTLDAIVELENVLHDRSSSTEFTRRLFTTLRDAPGFGFESPDQVRRASPRALAIYNRALRKSNVAPINNIDDLAKNIARFSSTVTAARDPVAKSDIRSLKDFCVALHRELLSETVAVDSGANWEKRHRDSAFGLL